MTRLGRIGALGVIGLLVVAGCSGSDSDSAADSSHGGGSAAAQTTATEATVQTTSPPATEPPTTEPPTTEPPTTALPTTGASTSDAAAAYDFSAIGPVGEQFVDAHGLDGAGLVVVDRDDGIVHEEYWGAFDADRVSLIASSSKMIVAGVLLHLDDAGLLDIDAPVADVAEWGTGNPTITPAQLVSNSSGLVGLLPNPGYGPYVCQFLPTGALQDCAASIFTTPDDDADIVAPDTEYRYGGAQWQVAGALAEVASGQSWQELVEEIYIEPCGVESLGFNNHWTQFGASGFDYPVDFDADPTTLQPTDNPNMEGGAYINAPDYAALLLMHLRDGRCGDTQVLSPEALNTMHTDRTAATYGSSNAYGMGWWIDAANERITDPGAYGAVPWLDLDDGYGAYLVVEADGETGNMLAAELYPLVEAAVTDAN